MIARMIRFDGKSVATFLNGEPNSLKMRERRDIFLEEDQFPKEKRAEKVWKLAEKWQQEVKAQDSDDVVIFLEFVGN